MSPLLLRASGRHLVRHPWQIGLSVLGIALGVAVALSIDLATQSARRAFELATEAVTGRATHQIVGGPSGLGEDVYRMLRLRLGVRQAAPVLAFDVTAPDHPGETFQLLGVDPFAEEPFRPHLASSDPGGVERGAGGPHPLAMLADLVGRPATGLISSATARRLGLARGDPLTIKVAGAARQVTLIGWLAPRDALSAQALERLLVTDIATAQELARARGLLERVGLADRAASFPDRLSGGEQQRVAVARALVHDPALILADEPTGTLDADTAAVVLDLLDRLVRELGKTVVMVTHSREVVGVADRVFAVQHGQLVEQGGGAG